MPWTDYLIGALIAVVAGLDRTAAFQFMVSRPIVAAPLTGWLLGDAAAGLQVGALVELLWLGRLPVGAAIPPDDTQVAVGATVLAIFFSGLSPFAALPAPLVSTLVAMPLGKAGQFFDRAARHWNGRLLHRAQQALAAGNLDEVERCHLRGMGHFALAAFVTYLVIVGGGSLLLPVLAPFFGDSVAEASTWLKLAFPLVGTAVILGTINVSRSLTLFGASFGSALLLLWLV
ncbi:MAG TPA: PTS sugar transporter subunit IIC [Deferrimonas sp.]|jgi:PTS system mannose-specific IIC component